MFIAQLFQPAQCAKQVGALGHTAVNFDILDPIDPLAIICLYRLDVQRVGDPRRVGDIELSPA